jgi:hypothetical protein
MMRQIHMDAEMASELGEEIEKAWKPSHHLSVGQSETHIKAQQPIQSL